ncbi:unnamed protein product [Staurois parvus]|uniref:Uncharacterized protein n=1 Tax=Staurois parvus TaxID=386267 RepID=A0ABN9CZ62_9NEOB|nr:unnamed protein product [Staurois parvus]
MAEECGDGDSSNGSGRTGTMRDSGLGSSMIEEAVYRGPWQIRGLAAAMDGRPVICSQHPMSKKFYTPAVCEET